MSGSGSRARRIGVRLALLTGTPIAIAALAVGWLAFRPLPVDFLLPALENALSQDEDRFEMDSASLTWGGLESGLDVHVRGIRLMNAKGELRAKFESVRLDLSARELFQGRFAPQALVFEGPALRLVRQADGSVNARVGTKPKKAGSSVVPDLLRALMADEEPGRPFSFLQRLAIRGGEVDFDDQMRGMAWEARPVEITIDRDPPGLRAAARLPAQASPDPLRPAVGASRVLLELGARAQPEGDDLDLQVTADLEDFDAATLGAWWPIRASRDARKWVVENIPSGTVQRAHLDLGLRFPDSDPAKLRLGSLAARVEAEDVRVDYLKPLPPVTGIDAVLDFGPDRFDFAIGGGTLEDVQIESGQVVLTDIRAKTPTLIAIDANVNGPVPTVVRILGQEPLGLIDQTVLAAGQTRGNLEGRVHFDFPLGDDLDLPDIRLNGEAKLHDVEIDSLPLPVRKGELEVGFSEKHVEIQGPVELKGVPASIQWNESFDVAEGSEQTLQIDVPSPRGSLVYTRRGDVTMFRFDTEDPGALLHAFEWSDRLSGGTAQVVARRAAEDEPFQGHFNISDYRILEAMWAVRLAQSLSVKGWVSSATGRGLAVQVTEGDFTYADDVIELLSLQLVTSDAALHATGQIQTSDQHVDIRGTFVPMQTLKRFLDHVPVLGRIFTGTKSEGVFVADFHVHGPMADPTADVSRLSSLSPGIVRNLVQKISRDEKPAQPAGS